MSIDLHLHTTASDGRLRPQELVKLALTQGLRVIAITDHDTTAGIAEAMEAGKELGIRVIPGVEISTDLSGEEVHILGYKIQYQDPQLTGVFKRLQEARHGRAQGIFRRLNQLGLTMAWSDVMEQVGDSDSIGRPHFARVMVTKGYVGSVAEAFDKFLTKGRPGWVERYKLSPKDAIRTIHEAGGLAFLAHPGLYQRGRELALSLAQEGLDGLEVFHSDHNPEQVQMFLSLAQQNRLLVSGGSDCHGVGRGQRKLMGSICVDEELLKAWL